MKFSAWFVFVLSVLALAGCQFEQQNLQVLTFVDQTLEDRREIHGIMQHLNAQLDRYQKGMRDFDTIMLCYRPIHRNTRSAATLAAETFTGRSDLRYLEERTQSLARIRTSLERILPEDGANPNLRRSDILGAIEVAHHFFSDDSTVVRQLFFYSDMVHFSEMALLREQHFRSGEIDGLVDQILQAKGWNARLLAGVKVAVFQPGTIYGTNAGSRMTLHQQQQLDQFWQTLFTRLGAVWQGREVIDYSLAHRE